MRQKKISPIYTILGLILVVVAVVGIFFLTRPEKNLQPASLLKESIKEDSNEVNKFIVSNPVDLTQIKKSPNLEAVPGMILAGKM